MVLTFTLFCCCLFAFFVFVQLFAPVRTVYICCRPLLREVTRTCFWPLPISKKSLYKKVKKSFEKAPLLWLFMRWRFFQLGVLPGTRLTMLVGTDWPHLAFWHCLSQHFLLSTFSCWDCCAVWLLTQRKLQTAVADAFTKSQNNLIDLVQCTPDFNDWKILSKPSDNI